MRPFPPEILLENYVGIDYFIPAPELEDWARKTFLMDNSPLYNEEHIHLWKAHIGYLWTNVPNIKLGQTVAATAEKPFFRGAAWVKHRNIMQMQEWFGDTPDFVLTFDARIAQESNDLQFCATVEHEFYHCGQKEDENGERLFNALTGQPIFVIKGHDVEEHVGIARRYGVKGCAGKTAEFYQALQELPEIGEAEVLGVCGTCGR